MFGTCFNPPPAHQPEETGQDGHADDEQRDVSIRLRLTSRRKKPQQPTPLGPTRRFNPPPAHQPEETVEGGRHDLRPMRFESASELTSRGNAGSGGGGDLAELPFQSASGSPARGNPPDALGSLKPFPIRLRLTSRRETRGRLADTTYALCVSIRLRLTSRRKPAGGSHYPEWLRKFQSASGSQPEELLEIKTKLVLEEMFQSASGSPAGGNVRLPPEGAARRAKFQSASGSPAGGNRPLGKWRRGKQLRGLIRGPPCQTSFPKRRLPMTCYNPFRHKE